MATDDKYDRQLRLWGAHGQRALMGAHICVLGSSPVASETLKNLVLPGIGRFTMVDSARVESADLGHNFFVEEGDLGKSRAAVVCRCLQELNPDVTGTSVDRQAESVISEGAPFFKQFHLVIACQLKDDLAADLGSVCKELGIGMVHLTSLGFVGKVRLYKEEHCVCETKPDSEFGDLRLTDPFPELRRFIDSVKLDDMDDVQHAHVPYVVILIKALDKFRKGPDGKLPSTKEEKEQFKQFIRGFRRNDKEVNFEEALDNAYKAWIPYSIPDPVRQVLEHKPTDPTSDFWVVARAVSQFRRDCGKLPLAGSLPDMTASTDMYVKLQEIYCNHAGGDCSAIHAHVAAIQADICMDSKIPQEYIQRWCANAQYCEMFAFRTIQQELDPSPPADESGNAPVDIAEEAGDEESLVQWYIALRAANRFRAERGHWPGALCGDGEAVLSADTATLTQMATAFLDGCKAEGVTADPKMLEEIVRYGGCEIHTTSSVIGGVAAQEAVKLVTGQYSPLNNTLIYDGLHGKSQTFEF